MVATRLTLISSLVASVAGQGGRGCRQPPAQSGAYTVTVNGVSRNYRLHVGTGYDQNTPTALVLGFHGWGGSGLGSELSSGWNGVANTHGLVVAYPTGYDDHPDGGGGWASWNGAGTTGSPGPEGRTCSTNNDYCYTSCINRPQGCNRCDWTTCFDDVAFVEALIDTVSDQTCIDDARVYGWGFSNGGQFMYELGFKLAHRFAALSPGGGHPHIGFNDPPGVAGGVRISMINIHGSNDYECPPYGGESGSGWYYINVADALPVWAVALGCTETARETPFLTPFDGTSDLECSRRGNCGSEDVVRCLWRGGHQWPQFWGARLAWWFFEERSRKGPRVVKALSYSNVTAPRPYDDSDHPRYMEAPGGPGARGRNDRTNIQFGGEHQEA